MKKLVALCVCIMMLMTVLIPQSLAVTSEDSCQWTETGRSSPTVNFYPCAQHANCTVRVRSVSVHYTCIDHYEEKNVVETDYSHNLSMKK